MIILKSIAVAIVSAVLNWLAGWIKSELVDRQVFEAIKQENEVLRKRLEAANTEIERLEATKDLAGSAL